MVEAALKDVVLITLIAAAIPVVPVPCKNGTPLMLRYTSTVPTVMPVVEAVTVGVVPAQILELLNVKVVV